ncbi:hypothetical protein CHLRE_02g086300v5 [Chlamydomonas reinhardtii]|uniref:Uncharacterized protein n=1 Tax=Chlamydomonas reinhardtii TaxID=3055 RepID=A0A2K3E0X9_CHLRE|nr:uncharacterized protein CHLRE_02g086300v5 [Chlamydomonas reinhardtii]PNW86434.1 hypothetical protein CHLRE_02g086300v5 [Chlamydomonas reinhardtii]
MALTPAEARGIRLEERAPSITTLIVDAMKSASASSSGPVCPAELPASAPTAAPKEAAALAPARFSGFSTEGPDGVTRPQPSPFASGDSHESDTGSHNAPDAAPEHPTPTGSASSDQQRLQQLLPGVLQSLLPSLLPALLPGAVAAAMPSASAAASAAAVTAGGSTAASATAVAITSAIVEAALPAALAAALPQALSAALSALFKSASGEESSSSSAPQQPQLTAGERQASLDQQGAAEQQLVRLLFGAEAVAEGGATAPAPAASQPVAVPKPSELDVGSPHGSVAAHSHNSGSSSPTERSSAAVAAAAAGNSMFSRRLSETTAIGSSAVAVVAGSAVTAQRAIAQPQHAHHAHGPVAGGGSRSSVHSGNHAQHWEGESSAEDALSTCSGDALVTPSPYGDVCCGNSSAPGTGAAVNSSANSFLFSGSSQAQLLPTGLSGSNIDGLGEVSSLYSMSGRDDLLSGNGNGPSPAELLMAAAGRVNGGNNATMALLAQHQHQHQQAAAAAAAQQQQQQQQQQFQLQQLQALVAAGAAGSDLGAPASPPLGLAPWRRDTDTVADLWGQADADSLSFAAASLALNQQQQQQQQAAGLLQQQQQQMLAQSLAAVAAANAAGRQLRAEDLLALGGNPAAAAAQLAAAAAAGGAVTNSPDLSTYMDAALRRMLLVSPQVAAELARVCGAFSGAQAQLHHLCCVIAEQLLDVAAMAPEVAAALLRALASHRARGAQATDVDPRVMGRILQLLRAGPAGRQLCLVSLEQWVDGLSRIHKRRAYLDTILHNYQLTLKRLVQAMGHQVHAVNMSLPRQLLNDLSPRALLLLTAELAPYPLLQPRRWSEEIIWAISQMHTMGVDMPLAPGTPAAAPAVAGQQPPVTTFQWEMRRALSATAEDIAAAGGAGGSPTGGSSLAAQLSGLGLGGAAGAAGVGANATCPNGAVPWAAHAALHRHLLMGLRRIQSRFFSERLRKVHGLYGEAVDSLLRTSLPQDVLVPEREMVVLVLVLLMLECRMRPEEFDAAFARDLQRCLAVSPVEEVAARLRCGLVPDSPLRMDPHKSRALSQLLKLGTLGGPF